MPEFAVKLHMRFLRSWAAEMKIHAAFVLRMVRFCLLVYECAQNMCTRAARPSFVQLHICTAFFVTTRIPLIFFIATTGGTLFLLVQCFNIGVLILIKVGSLNITLLDVTTP